MEKKCKVCGSSFKTIKSWENRRGFYCSPKCYGLAKKGKPAWNKGLKGVQVAWSKGKKNPQVAGYKNGNWKGGRYENTAGYIFIKKNNHPFRNKQGYVREHRLIIEKHLGRYLYPKEKVHHLGEKDDNRHFMLIAFVDNATHKKFENGNLIKQEEIVFDGRKLKEGIVI